MSDKVNRKKFIDWIYKQDMAFLRELNGMFSNLPDSADLINIDGIKLVLECVLQLNDISSEEWLKRHESPKYESKD